MSTTWNLEPPAHVGFGDWALVQEASHGAMPLEREPLELNADDDHLEREAAGVLTVDLIPPEVLVPIGQEERGWGGPEDEFVRIV